MINRFEELANAVVVQACRDYRDALITLKRFPRDTRAKVTVSECEGFFRSEWYGILTDLNAEILMKRIKREVNAV